MFESIGQIIDWLLMLFPRIEVVSSKEAGVAYVRGKPRLIKPESVCIYWPVWTETEWVDIQRQDLDIPTQHITVEDGKILRVTGLVVWSVRDPLLAVTSVDDIEDHVAGQAMLVVRNTTYGLDVETITATEGELEQTMRRELQSALRGCGVKIHSFCWTEIVVSGGMILLGMERE